MDTPAFPSSNEDESPVLLIHITAAFKDGVWTVSCPEWKYEAPTRRLTRTVARLASEIELLNEGGNIFDTIILRGTNITP